MTSAPLTVHQDESGRDWRLWFGIAITLVWLGLGFVYIDLSDSAASGAVGFSRTAASLSRPSRFTDVASWW